jgi:hypothetical protein
VRLERGGAPAVDVSIAVDTFRCAISPVSWESDPHAGFGLSVIAPCRCSRKADSQGCKFCPPRGLFRLDLHASKAYTVGAGALHSQS